MSPEPSTPPPVSEPTSGAPVGSTMGALEVEATAHAVGLMRLVSVCALLGAFVVWLMLPPGPLFTLTVSICGALAALAILGQWLMPRMRLKAQHMVVLPMLAGAVGLLTLHYFGLFQSIPTIAAVALYIVGTQDNTRQVLPPVVLFVLGYIVIGLLVLTGHISIQRMPIVADPSPRLVATAVLFNGVLLAGAFVLGCVMRRGTLQAMEELEKVTRRATRSDALLREARGEVQQLRQAGGDGRYSGRLFGTYRLHEVIGRGAMGEVYRATTTERGGDAAVKVLYPHAASDPELLLRFKREAEIMRSVDSPHIVKLLQQGETDDCAYLVMELLSGQDLSTILQEQGALPIEDVVTLVSQVASGLAAAAAHDVVHRDLKPANLFATRVGAALRWKILDFGAARLGSMANPQSGRMILGTPGYMSPEQARGAEADVRADVFSLAAIIYRCLVGHPAFTAADPATTLQQVMHEQPLRPTMDVEMNDDLQRVLVLGLAKDRDARFESPTALADALRDASQSALSTDIRERADALLQQAPWSAWRRGPG